MILSGAAYVSLWVETQNIDSKIFIFFDIANLILGIDCMEKQATVWDTGKKQVLTGDAVWINLKHEPESNKVRKVYVIEETVLLSNQQTTVNVRIERTGRQDIAFTGLMKNGQVSGLC